MSSAPIRLKFCDAGGYLVGGNGEVPDDPSEYQSDLRQPVIGCNQLVCARCRAVVRSTHGLYPLPLDHERDWAAIYATDDWSTLPAMEPDPAYRLYVCKCRFEAVRHSDPLVRDDQTATPWRCGGHPPATFPLLIGDIEITRFTDLEKIVREHLDTPDPILTTLYERLAGTPLEGTIGSLASRLLSDPNPRAKMLALGLFWLHPEAPGAGRVFELANGDRAGFIGVADPVPIAGCLTLESRLLRTVAKLWAADVVPYEAGRDLLRRAALERETSRAVIPTLSQLDGEWLRSHADTIKSMNDG